MSRLTINFYSFLILISCLSVSVDVRASRSAEQVVYAQLEALQRWDGSSVNQALREVWELAHPNNKKMTGPIERFARLLASPGYQPLIGHRAHEISPLGQNREKNNDRDTATFSVSVLAVDGLIYAFIWQLSHAESSDGKVWMTTSVSPARSTGKQLSGVLTPMRKDVYLR